MNERTKEAYRLFDAPLSLYQRFRRGDIIKLSIEADTGFSDGVHQQDRMEAVGQFQLRYIQGSKPAMYAVFGRENSQQEWDRVDGPWVCGSGPYD